MFDGIQDEVIINRACPPGCTGDGVEVAKLKELLREIAFSDNPYCPICKGNSDYVGNIKGHRNDCRLAKALEE